MWLGLCRPALWAWLVLPSQSGWLPSHPCLPGYSATLAGMQAFTMSTLPASQTIHDLVMELGYEDTSTEVYTVDSQVRGKFFRALVGASNCTLLIRHCSRCLHTPTTPSAPPTRSTLICRPLLAPLLQYSLQGGVVVQVTGVMQRPGGPKRPFVQVRAVCKGWTAAVGKGVVCRVGCRALPCSRHADAV